MSSGPQRARRGRQCKLRRHNSRDPWHADLPRIRLSGPNGRSRPVPHPKRPDTALRNLAGNRLHHRFD
jgi:hypothetical protein